MIELKYGTVEIHDPTILIHMPTSMTETPCIGICSTIYGDEVCRGCMRTYQEVIDWNGFSDSQKISVLDRLELQMVPVLEQRFQITDQEKLVSKLEKHAIKYRKQYSPLCWGYSLIRQGAEYIQDLSKYGLTIQPQYRDLTPLQLLEDIDDELHQNAMIAAGF